MRPVDALLLGVICALHPVRAAPQHVETSASFDSYLEIAVSATTTGSTELRGLNIAWKNPKYTKGDFVGLYDVEPESYDAKFLFKSEVSSQEGHLSTGVMESRTFQETPNFKKTCLGYWAAYWRMDSGPSDRPILKNCLTTNPTWMEENWGSIKDVPVKRLFWPGAHDAGSYQPKLLPPYHLLNVLPSRFQKYIHTQDESILEQLIHGVRYLDFRIARYPSGFWLNHDTVKVNKLEFLLEEIKTFINNTSHEIVIVDAHNFPVGFSKRPGSHTELVDFLKERIGNHMCECVGYSATLEQIRKTGKRLIFAYNNISVASRNPMVLWPPVQQQWGNKKTITALQEYIQTILDERTPRTSVWSIMAELTPDVRMVITDELGGLRKMADLTNSDVTKWFFGTWGLKVNVVAIDFVRSSAIVAAAIHKNVEKYNRAHPQLGKL